jgi:hypothetical protein
MPHVASAETRRLAPPMCLPRARRDAPLRGATVALLAPRPASAVRFHVAALRTRCFAQVGERFVLGCALAGDVDFEALSHEELALAGDGRRVNAFTTALHPRPLRLARPSLCGESFADDSLIMRRREADSFDRRAHPTGRRAHERDANARLAGRYADERDARAHRAGRRANERDAVRTYYPCRGQTRERPTCPRPPSVLSRTERARARPAPTLAVMRGRAFPVSVGGATVIVAGGGTRQAKPATVDARDGWFIDAMALHAMHGRR